MAPFPLGRVIATTGALKLLKNGEDPLRYLARHRPETGGPGRPRPSGKRAVPEARPAHPQLLPGGREDHLDHHRGRPVRHHHPLTGGVLNENTRLRTLLQGLLVRRRQVPHPYLPGG